MQYIIIEFYILTSLVLSHECRLRQECGAYGEVTDVFLPVECGTNCHRGYGFVPFANGNSAQDAISKMDQSQLDGRVL